MKATTKIMLVSALAGVVMAGCSSQPKGPTQRELAKQQWDATRANVQLKLAEDQFRMNDLDKAGATLGQAMAAQPENPKLYILAARISIERGKLEQAMNSLDMAGKLDPNDAEVDYVTGVVHQRWQQNAKALASYKTASEKSPGDLAYLLAYSDMLTQTGYPEAALALLEERSPAFAHSAALEDARGQLYEMLGQHDQAVPRFRRASLLEPEDKTLRERFAFSLVRTGQSDEAMHVLGRMLEDTDSQGRADLWIAFGQCALDRSRGLDARDAFAKASRLDEKNADAWIGLAKAGLMLGEWRRAEIAASRATGLRPNDADTLLLLGTSQYRSELFPQAMQQFTRANQIRPNDPTTALMIGLTHRKLGNDLDASKWFDQSLSLDSKAISSSPAIASTPID